MTSFILDFLCGVINLCDGGNLKFRFMRAFKVLLFISLLFLTPHANSYGQGGKLFKIFPASSPEQQGMSSLVLDSMMLFIKNTNQNIHHITIIRNDQTVLDAISILTHPNTSMTWLL
jgi:hypothetical protein